MISGRNESIRMCVRLGLLIDYLERYRCEQGWSQNELATHLNVSRGSMSKIMSGKQTTITLDFLDKVARVTGADIGDLACMALGRPARFSSDMESKMRRVLQLSGDHAVLWDMLLLVAKNLDNPTKLRAIADLLK